MRHPEQPLAVAAVLELTDRAVATSGGYERGDHIWLADPDRPQLLRSATVVGPQLGTADALATAAFADGGHRLDWLGSFPGYDLLLVTSDDRVRWTPVLDGRWLPETEGQTMYWSWRVYRSRHSCSLGSRPEAPISARASK